MPDLSSPPILSAVTTSPPTANYRVRESLRPFFPNQRARNTNNIRKIE